jgi:hypothetical protein
VETTQLEPLVCTQDFIRFQLQPKGILSRDSMVQLRYFSSDAADGKLFHPINCGISAAIRTATLKIGGVIINKLEDVPFYHAQTKAFNSPAYRCGIDLHLHGINNVISQNSANVHESGTFGLRDVHPSDPKTASLPYTMLLRKRDEGGPMHGIFLRDLFPILDHIELPLFLMGDAGDIYIELQLNRQTSTATGHTVGNVGGDVLKNGLGTIADCMADGGTRSDVDTSCVLDTDSVKMFVDRLYFEDDRMAMRAEQLNASKGRSLKYVDVIHTTASLPQTSRASAPATGTVDEATFTNQIAVSGMNLQNIRCCFTTSEYTTMKSTGAASSTPKFSRDFVGRYSMLATPKSDSFNVRLNDQLFYNKEVSNTAFKAAELESIYGVPLALSTALYSLDAITEKTGAFDAKTHLMPDTGSYQLAGGLELRQLEGSHYFFGTNVTTAFGNAADDYVRVSQKPVEVVHRFPRNEDTNFNYTFRYFAEIVRNFAMKDGRVEVFS